MQPTKHTSHTVSILFSCGNDSLQVLGTFFFDHKMSSITYDDATWILTSSFVIFTMQTGFSLLESGACGKKNEVNIMMKNLVDVILGGLFYWAIGYGLQYGNDDTCRTSWYGCGHWFLDSSQEDMGKEFATFIFQLSFCTTATTIVSGSMAERTNFNAYILFSFLNTIVYCIPAGWIWRDTGWLYQLGCLDFAGSACVHLIGGVSALVAAYMLKPRIYRYEQGVDSESMGNPVNAILGNFALWWGWLGFNCGSTFGVSGNKWEFAERAAVTTLNSSFSGGMLALAYSYYSLKKIDIALVINGILGGLVAVTSCAAFVLPLDSLIIGVLGSMVTMMVQPVMDYYHIDDPVGAVAVHGGAGIVGALSVGLFTINEPYANTNLLTRGQSGLFRGGGMRLFGVQLLAIICVATWSGVTTWMLLAAIDKVVPIRMCIEEEILGADIWIHNIKHEVYDYNSMVEEMRKEKLLLLPHITTESKSTLEYNIFIVNRFLVKESDSYWWRRLNEQDRVLTTTRPMRANSQMHQLYDRTKQVLRKVWQHVKNVNNFATR